ncbi:DMT family transporter [Amycolatopsis thermophila]|uniref:Drug/metabolite transporter (DMT)-like permease n=1 Tax=Amycolatopsis thermophila TaxID=206084 RepID=A0ABU0F3I3_9PSEU|nr:DMT family transporter [Amycolatopsis thermophila]MDQ0382107.1 drug/metabolite transporter (DMT)-like permease [Amycolatopsis thermophila]
MRPAWGVATGALTVSASAVLIELSGTAPGTASFYRCLLALPPLAVLAARERAGAASRADVVRAALAGVFFAGDSLLWTQAIGEVGAGLSTVLVNLQVVIVPLIAWLVDRERVPPRYLLAVVLVLPGVVLAAGLTGGSTGPAPLAGAIHASLAALCYSAFLFLLRRGGQDGRTRRPYFVVTASAAIVSAIAGLLGYGLDLAPGWAAIGWLVLVAVSGQVLGWLLVAVGAPRLPSHVGAVLLLLTPVGAVVLGALVLGERLSPSQLIGCALVLTGAVVAARR